MNSQESTTASNRARTVGGALDVPVKCPNQSIHRACIHHPELIDFNTRLAPACNGSWIQFGVVDPEWFDYLSRITDKPIHTIRPMWEETMLMDLDPDHKRYVSQCEFDEAEFFTLSRYEGPDNELRLVKDFPTYKAAHDFVVDNKMRLEIICTHEGCGITELQEELNQLACFGGASGDAFACHDHFIDHLQHGGIDGDGKEPCQTCQIADLLPPTRSRPRQCTDGA